MMRLIKSWCSLVANESSLSQLFEAKRDAERNGSSSGKAYVDISELLKQDDLETLDDFERRKRAM